MNKIKKFENFSEEMKDVKDSLHEHIPETDDISMDDTDYEKTSDDKAIENLYNTIRKAQEKLGKSKVAHILSKFKS